MARRPATGRCTMKRVRPGVGARRRDAAAVPLDDRLARSTGRARGRAAPAPGRPRGGTARRSSRVRCRSRPGPSSSTVRRSTGAVDARAPTRTHAAFRPELVGVRQQVHEHLHQPRRVADDGRAVFRQPRLAGPGRAARTGCRTSSTASRTTSSSCDAAGADAELARLDAHALEQVVDQARQPQRAPLQRRRPALPAARAAARAGSPAAARSTPAAPPAACGTRARCWRGSSRARGAPPRGRSRRASPAPAGRRPCGRW